jgi:hypothetical protein
MLVKISHLSGEIENFFDLLDVQTLLIRNVSSEQPKFRVFIILKSYINH